MRTPQDVLLSVQRFASLILPAPWNVRLIGENMSQARPFAFISQNGTVTTVGKFGAHSIRMQGAYTIHAYLPRGATREAAELASQVVEEAFWQAIKLTGIEVGSISVSASLAPTALKADVIPLWDFVGDTTGGVDPPRGYADFATVDSFQTRPIPDAEDPRSQTVVCDLRLTWMRSGATATPGTNDVDAVRVSGSLEL